jgi:hypothetical protein
MSTATASPVTLVFRNSNTHFHPGNVYVTFCGADRLVGSIGQTQLRPGKSYSFEQVMASGGVSLYYSHSGRICISLGAPLTTPSAANGYAPNFANPSLGDYSTRWDKAEITYNGSSGGSGGINLSAQDFFSIPMQIKAAGQKTLGIRQSTAKVMQGLGALSKFAQINADGTFPQGALAVGSTGVAVPGASQPVIRIISPGTVTPFANGSTVYPSLAKYVSFVAGSPATTVSGNNGAGQSYRFVATISANTLTLNGTVNGGSGDVPTTASVVNLTDTMIYGANPPFVITQGSDLNGMVTRAMADYFAGLNFGFVNSPEILPGQATQTVGGVETWHWYGNIPDGLDQPPLPITAAFSSAQPSNAYYDVYANYLAAVSDAYGFAYNDRLQSPLTNLTGGKTVTIEILPDTRS